MTRQEAIEILQSGAGIWPMTDRANNALNKAIKALEQAPCEDAISRTWLKKAFHNYFQGLVHVVTEEDVQAYIDVAPSVTPKQRTGHWIFEKGDEKTCVDGYVCSACNKSFHTHVPYFAEYKYCPNCGCRMVEP